MSTLDSMRLFAQRKRRENLILALAYAKTLTLLSPANLLLVVGAALLSLVAGATILVDSQIIDARLSGILALISGGLTIVHSKLGCEQYQADCRKMLGLHRAIAEDYENLQVIDDPAVFGERLDALNNVMSSSLKSGSTLPFSRQFMKAQREIDADESRHEARHQASRHLLDAQVVRPGVEH